MEKNSDIEAEAAEYLKGIEGYTESWDMVEVLIGFVKLRTENLTKQFEELKLLSEAELEKKIEYSRELENLKSSINELIKLNPYRELGNRESYSDYNQGWQDALGSIELISSTEHS